jgi:hypothetical protein
MRSASEQPSAGERVATTPIDQVHGLRRQLDTLDATIQRRSFELQSDLQTLLQAVELIHDDDPAARRCLRELRAAPAYEEAFTAPDPLVSVVIPTWDRPETLVERSIPSALNQTYQNIEVIVVGDASPPATPAAVAALSDPRVSFHNLTIRGPYDEDPGRSWLASGTPGFNAGVAMARGLWIAPLGDDDSFVPEHVERLLADARDRRLEFVYGQIRQVLADGGQALLGEFPPRLSQIGLQAAIYHAGLSFMELELGHALFGTPNDWGLVHRMMRAGVRMGMVDEVTVNYWPSLRAAPPARAGEGAPVDSRLLADTQRQLTEAQVRALELEQRLADELARSSALDAQVIDLARRLDDVVGSRSWRLTAPLRRARART